MTQEEREQERETDVTNGYKDLIPNLLHQAPLCGGVRAS